MAYRWDFVPLIHIHQGGGEGKEVWQKSFISLALFILLQCHVICTSHPEGEGRGLAQPSSSAWRLESGAVGPWGRGAVGRRRSCLLGR